MPEAASRGDFLPDFLRHYRRFLGLDEGRFASGETVFACAQRDVPVGRSDYFPLVATRYRGRVVLSVSPAFERDLRAWIASRRIEDLDDELLGEIDDFFLERLPLRRVWRMWRLTTTSDRLVLPAAIERVEVVTEAHREAFFERMRPRGKLVRRSWWSRDRVLREEGRRFVVMEDGAVAADGSVSDVDWGGGQIAVATDARHRRKGYGSAVAARAARWCLERDLVPVYFVRRRNEPSIRLAERLGFVRQSEEIVVRVVR